MTSQTPFKLCDCTIIKRFGRFSTAAIVLVAVGLATQFFCELLGHGTGTVDYDTRVRDLPRCGMYGMCQGKVLEDKDTRS